MSIVIVNIIIINSDKRWFGIAIPILQYRVKNEKYLSQSSASSGICIYNDFTYIRY
jgi:hypothetical protein